jgi:competence protein ComEC
VGGRAAIACLGLAGGIALTAWGGSGDARQSTPGRLQAAAAGLLSALAGFAVAATAPAPSTLPPDGMARLEAVVETVRPGHDGRTRSRIRVVHGTRLEDGAAIAAGTRLWASPQPLPAGARVQLLAKLTPRLPFRNPSPHPELPAPFPTVGRAFVPGPDAVRVLQRPATLAWMDRARGHVRDALTGTLQPGHAGVARALVLGEGGAVLDADRQRVRGAGLAHLLAVSGLHVAILAGFGVLLMRWLLLHTPVAERTDPLRVAAAGGIPLALGYAAFAGGASSAWRAAITASIAWGLIAAGKRPGATAVAALAVLVLSVGAPDRVLSPGLLLSVVATAAVLTTARPTQRGFGAWLATAFAISTRTTLATAPIVLWCFGAVPIAGVVANVVLVPVGTMALVPLAALHAAVASAGVSVAADVSGWCFELVCDAFLAAAGVFAQLGEGLPWPPPSVPQGITLAVGVALLLGLRDARSRCAVGLACAAFLGVFEWQLRTSERPEGLLRVTFADVGQGDAALIDLPDGRLMMIDAGGNPGGGPDPGRAALVPLLKARRRARVDIAVLSHPHPDHYGGFRAVMDAMPIDELWDSGQAHDETDLAPTSAEAAELIDALRARGTRVRRPAELCGRELAAGGASVRVLSPCPRYDSGHDANENSLVLRLEYGRRSFLFTGDAELHTEARLVAQGSPLRADVLKVGHHGSRTSTTAAFLAAVAPRIAIISAGAGNRFGHPHLEVEQRLRDAVPRVHDLASTGGLIVETDGERLTLQ